MNIASKQYFKKRRCVNIAASQQYSKCKQSTLQIKHDAAQHVICRKSNPEQNSNTNDYGNPSLTRKKYTAHSMKLIQTKPESKENKSDYKTPDTAEKNDIEQHEIYTQLNPELKAHTDEYKKSYIAKKHCVSQHTLCTQISSTTKQSQ